MRALLLALAACSSAAPRPAPPPPAPPPARVSVDQTPNAPDCPASATDATGTCTLEDDVMDVRCVYANTACACRSSLDSYCGGAAPPPPTSRWTCAPTQRADGCPTIVPRAGTRCRTPDQRCAYDADCCHGAFTCSNAAWTGRYECLPARG